MDTRTCGHVHPAHPAILQQRRPLKPTGEIPISIGKPVSPEGRTAEEVAALVESWIETEMRRLAPHRYDGPYVGASRVGQSNNRSTSPTAI